MWIPSVFGLLSGAVITKFLISVLLHSINSTCACELLIKWRLLRLVSLHEMIFVACSNGSRFSQVNSSIWSRFVSRNHFFVNKIALCRILTVGAIKVRPSYQKWKKHQIRGLICIWKFLFWFTLTKLGWSLHDWFHQPVPRPSILPMPEPVILSLLIPLKASHRLLSVPAHSFGEVGATITPFICDNLHLPEDR